MVQIRKSLLTKFFSCYYKNGATDIFILNTDKYAIESTSVGPTQNCYKCNFDLIENESRKGCKSIQASQPKNLRETDRTNLEALNVGQGITNHPFQMLRALQCESATLIVDRSPKFLVEVLKVDLERVYKSLTESFGARSSAEEFLKYSPRYL